MGKKKYPLIVFCGMDGTGKTTLAQRLVEYFTRQGQRAELIHGHGYSISQDSFGLDAQKVKSLKYLLRLLIPLAYLDNLFTFYFRYRSKLKKGILVCDRYFYDKLARMLYFGICNKPIARFYLKLLPKPNFTFFLDSSPREAYIRKQEYPPTDLQRYRKAYRFLAEHLKSPMIDTGQSMQVCCKEILNFIKR